MRKGFVILVCILIIFCLFGCAGESTDESVEVSCEHRFTKTEEVDPTCNSEGFKKLVCDLCGKENTISTPKWEHQFKDPMVTKEPTCVSAGEQQEICKLCAYVKTSTVDKLSHNYKNKVCTVCGEKKPVQKANDVEPNTWYAYNNILYFQNCKLLTVGGGSTAMLVHYAVVCQYCHVVEDSSGLAYPEVNREAKKIHYCSECNRQTLVRFKIG